MEALDLFGIKEGVSTKVRINKRSTYTIVWVDGFADPKDDAWCVYKKNQIIIRKGMPPRQLLFTFIHELLHAVQYEYDVGMTERQVDKLETAIGKVSALNGWL